MLYRSYVPHAPLCQFVSDFWLYENYEAAHQRELILPSGTFEMVFNLREDEMRIYRPAEPERYRRFSGAVVSGPYSTSFMSDTAEEKSLLGVHFKPGGAVAILGLPAGELQDTHVDLSDIWGPLARTLRERLCAVKNPAEKFRLLERAFKQHFATYSGGHGAVRIALDVLMKTHGQTKTRDIASTVSLSQRRLITLFSAEVGLTPKLFGRVQRFQHAIQQSRHTSNVEWAQLALDCGFFDQSHLIRDFVALAGVRPDDYRRCQNQLDRSGTHTKRNHLPVAGQFNFFQ